jgi:Zn ribbon nucleic-acid-binding protein
VPFYARVRCPSCKAKGARQYGRVGMLRYHHCTNCGERFKSYEASDD